MIMISVIIPTYARSDLVERAIISVLRQTFDEFEIIVVDDNGRNTEEQLNTQKVLTKYSNDRRVKYLVNRVPLGGSAARNAGVENCTGQYVTFLDDDDEYHCQKLKTQMEFYKTKFPKNDGFLNGQIELVKNGKSRAAQKLTIDYNNLLFSAVSENILGTPTFFMPKSVFLSVGGFPNIPKGQEWYLSVKLIERGTKFFSMSERLVSVHIHGRDSVGNGGGSAKSQAHNLKLIFEIQSGYFKFFTKKEINHIKSSHYLGLSLVYLKSDEKKFFHCAFRGLRYKVYNRKAIWVLAKYSEHLCRKVIESAVRIDR